MSRLSSGMSYTIESRFSCLKTSFTQKDKQTIIQIASDYEIQKRQLTSWKSIPRWYYDQYINCQLSWDGLQEWKITTQDRDQTPGQVRGPVLHGHPLISPRIEQI